MNLICYYQHQMLRRCTSDVEINQLVYEAIHSIYKRKLTEILPQAKVENFHCTITKGKVVRKMLITAESEANNVHLELVTHH